jgi:hypothetical protein
MMDEERKKRAMRKAGVVLGVVVLGALILISIAPIQDYIWYKKHQRLMVEHEREVAEYKAALAAEMEADTYGGATAPETLQMYIEAIEARDLELASKYATIEYRDEVYEYLLNEEEYLDGYVEILKRLELDDKEVEVRESYAREVEGYGFAIPRDEEEYVAEALEQYKDVESMSVWLDEMPFSMTFKLYPSGVWKISML